MFQPARRQFLATAATLPAAAALAYTSAHGGIAENAHAPLPMLHVTDIQCVSNIAHKKNVKVVVDNTFASPYIQRPLTMGAEKLVPTE